jgi:hypothetical protein
MQCPLNDMPTWSQGGQPWLQGGPQQWAQTGPQAQWQQWGLVGLYLQWGGLVGVGGSTFNMLPQQNYGASGGQWGVGVGGWNARGAQNTTPMALIGLESCVSSYRNCMPNLEYPSPQGGPSLQQ